MVPIASLWLAILLSSVAVFFVSFLVWMVLPHHRSDWSKLPDEEGFSAAVRATGAGPGQYQFPYCATPKEMNEPEFMEKQAKGPVGQLILFPTGPQSLAKNLTLYFLYSLVVSWLVAYLTSRTVAPGADYLTVFRVAGTAAWLAYSWALPPLAIWFGRSWSSVLKEMLDGLAYALLTAGFFGWLWPA